MSKRVKEILGVVRDRLQRTGYPLIAGRYIDVETDPTPAVSLSFHPENGVTSDEMGRMDTARAISRQTLTLVVAACTKITDQAQALEELEDLHTAVHATLFDPEDRRLQVLARDAMMLQSRQSYVPVQYSDKGMIEMVVTIPYFEEY